VPMVPNAARVPRVEDHPLPHRFETTVASCVVGRVAIVGKHPVMAAAWFRRGRWRIAPAVNLPHALRNASPRTTFIIGAG
jgi:hypothetical protein